MVETQIARCEHDQGASEIDTDIEQDFAHLHDDFAHAQRGLHHLGGDPTGEVVLEEIHALAQHIAMGLPACPHGEIADQPLVDDRLVPEFQEWQDEQNERAHAGEAEPVVLPEGLAVGGGQPVDQLADKGEERHLDERHHAGEQRRGEQQRPKRLGIVQNEAEKRRRRPFRKRFRKAVSTGFEPAKNRGDHGGLRSAVEAVASGQ